MKIISLGLGVQSTAMYYMSCMGELSRCDYAIFVDTGKEKKKTIQYLKYLQQWQKLNNGIPIIVVRKKNLYKDLLNSENSRGQRFSSIPSFTKNEDGSTGMLRRQCTSEYKIEQVDATIREILSIPSLRGYKIEVWKGITLDELDRVSIPQEQWKIQVYPFCSLKSFHNTHEWMGLPKLTRNDVINWYNKKGFPIPPKSSCVFCPYQSDAAWYDMKINEPSDFKAAIRIDKAIRNSTKKGILSQAFLHESCIPLGQIDFKPGLPDLWHGECSGACHI